VSAVAEGGEVVELAEEAVGVEVEVCHVLVAQ
jgi:hypothetical protein